MKQLAFVWFVLATFACQQKIEPKPGETKAGDPPAIAEPVLVKPEPNAPCVVVVKITDHIEYEGGGVKGTRAVDTLELSELKPLAGKCAAVITAADTIGYNDVVRVMDLVVAAGITAVSLGGTSSPTNHDKPTSAKQALNNTPVITMSTTTVAVTGKIVGKPDDAGLGAAIGAALPPNPKDPSLILQVDKTLAFGVVRTAIDASAKAGYTNVMFAVQKR